tara:strand:+ start:1940 stop:2311 length:372 start_codon:yes stop_codon:yes gene_type:complete
MFKITESRHRPEKAYSNLGLVLAVILWAVLMAAAPRLVSVEDTVSGALAVLFLPGTEESEIMAAVSAAGGQVLRGGAFSNVLVVRGDTPGFAGRLKGAGAWGVLSPALATGCLLIPRDALPAQ